MNVSFYHGASPLLNSLIIVLEKRVKERSTESALDGGEVDEQSHLEKN